MSTSLTSEQAIALLREHPEAYRSSDNLRALAAQVDADSAGRLTVLYSGSANKYVGSSEVVKAMVRAGEDVRVIDKSQAAEFLQSEDFYYSLAKTYGLEDFRPLADGAYRGPATDWLYHPTEGPWADASARFARATVGEVRAIVGDAHPDRVFGATEVSNTLANQKANPIEGIQREVLVAVQARHGTEAAFDMIVERARTNVGQLRVATNYAGMPLRENGRLLLDTRAYFAGTTIEGKAPSFNGSTWPLVEHMGPPSSHVVAGQQHWLDWERRTTQVERSVPLAPKVLQTAMSAAVLYDTAKTASRTSDLLEQGNIAGSQSELTRYGAGTLGMLAGAQAGATAGALFGIESGPGIFVTGAIGGAIGMWGGNKAVDAIDHWKVAHQTDSQGHVWSYDEKVGWGRDIPPLPGSPHGQHLTAEPALAKQLTYQANVTSVELALARVSPPRDPYIQSVSPGDTASVKDASWVRADSGIWSRHVTDKVLEHGLTAAHSETASPARAAELDQAANKTVMDNLANSPRGIAESYQADYVKRGWEQQGPLPEAVVQALKQPDNILTASDGHTYTREAGGEWTRPGMLFGTNTAEGRVRDELNATLLASQHTSGSDAAGTAATSLAPVAHLERTPAALHAEAARSVASMHGGDAAARHQAAKVLADQARVEPTSSPHLPASSTDHALPTLRLHDSVDAHHSPRAASHAHGADTAAQQQAQEQAAHAAELHVQQRAHHLAQEEQKLYAAQAAQKNDLRAAEQERAQGETRAQQATQARETEQRESRLQEHEQHHAMDTRDAERRQTEDTHRVEQQAEVKAPSGPNHAMAESAHAAQSAADASLPLAAPAASAGKMPVSEPHGQQEGKLQTPVIPTKDAGEHAAVLPRDSSSSASHQLPATDPMGRHAATKMVAKPDASAPSTDGWQQALQAPSSREHADNGVLAKHRAQQAMETIPGAHRRPTQILPPGLHGEEAATNAASTHIVEPGEASESRDEMNQARATMPQHRAPESAADQAHVAPLSTEALSMPTSASQHVEAERSSQSTEHSPIGRTGDLIVMSEPSQITMMGKGGQSTDARDPDAMVTLGAANKANPFGAGKAMADQDIEELWFALQSKNPLAIDEACEKLAQRPEAQSLMKQADDYMFHSEVEQMKQQLAWASPESAQMIAAQAPDAVKQEAPVLVMSLLNHAPPGAPGFAASSDGGGGASAGSGGGGGGGGG